MGRSAGPIGRADHRTGERPITASIAEDLARLASGGAWRCGMGRADATAEPTICGRARTYTRPLQEEQEEARRFLTARTSEWAEARARWCDIAGISAENLALCVANVAMSWANSARRRTLGLPASTGRAYAKGLINGDPI